MAVRSSLPRRPLLLAAALGFAGRVRAAVEEELAVIVHPGLRTRVLTGPQLELIFLCEHQSWPEGTSIVPVSYPSGHALRSRFDHIVMGLAPESARKHWEGQLTAGGLRPPRSAPSPELAQRLVAKLAGSIGYVPAALLDGKTRVVARIRGQSITSP